MNSSSVKMKEEDDRYKQNNERITQNGTSLIWTKNTKTEVTNPGEHMWIRIKVGMTIQNARTECTAKPITFAFIHFKNDDERNKYIRSANML